MRDLTAFGRGRVGSVAVLPGTANRTSAAVIGNFYPADRHARSISWLWPP